MSFKHLSISELKEKLKQTQNLQLVDIRDANSFSAGHIERSFNLNNDNLHNYITQADLDMPLVVICYHGISSQQAAGFMIEQGFDDVYSLDGGYQAWHDAVQLQQ